MFEQLLFQQSITCDWIFRPFCPANFYSTYVPFLTIAFYGSAIAVMSSFVVALRGVIDLNRQLVVGLTGLSFCTGVVVVMPNTYSIFLLMALIAVQAAVQITRKRGPVSTQH